MNLVTIIGNIGKDAELRSTSNGDDVASFSVATSKRWVDKSGNKQEKTTWHNVVYWRPGGVAPFLKRGKQVAIFGEIDNRMYEDKNGDKRFTSEIVVDRLQLLGGGSERDEEPAASTQRAANPSTSGRVNQSAARPQQNAGRGNPTAAGVTDDDLPF